MKVNAASKAHKTQPVQALAAQAAAAAAQSGAGSEADLLLQEFSEVMDKIAAKVRENSPKRNDSPFSDFGLSEVSQAAAQISAPEKPKALDRKESKSEKVESETEIAAAPERRSSEPKREKETELKAKETAEQKSPEKKEQGQKETAPAEKVSAPQKGEVAVVKQVTEKSALEVEKQVVQKQPAVQLPQQAAQSKEVKAEVPVEAAAPVAQEVVKEVSVKPLAAKAGAQKVEKVEGAKDLRSEEVLKAAHATAAAVEVKTAEVKAAPEPEAEVDVTAAIINQVRAKLAAALTAEVSRMRVDTSRVQQGIEREIAGASGLIKQAAEQVSGKLSMESKQVNALAPSNNSGVFGKSSEQAGQSENLRAAKPLPPALSNRTLEKVENVLKEAAKSRDGKTISLRLDPPDLGSVKVDVSLRDGQLHARVVAESPSVTQLLRDKAQELQLSLRKLGLHVDTITVSVGQEQMTSGQNNHSSSESQRPSQFFGNVSAVKSNAVSTPVESQPQVLDHWVA